MPNNTSSTEGIDKKPSFFHDLLRANNAFAQSRRDTYAEDHATIEEINNFVANKSSSGGLIVSGSSGSGKSALLAWWTNDYRQRHPETLVLEHYIGAAPGGDDPVIILRFIMQILQESIKADLSLPDQPEDIIQEFPLWLAHPHQLVLVIDGLDQIHSSHYPSFSWLPTHIPPNVHLIVSTLDGQPHKLLAERSWQELKVTPLNSQQRSQVVRRYLQQRQVELTPAKLHAISQNPHTANPLYLRTGLEELKAGEQVEDQSDIIDQYFSAEGIDDLYGVILKRIEENHGEEICRDVLTSLAVAREGLSAEESHDLLQLQLNDVTDLINDLSFHLMKYEGLYSFHHRSLHETVVNRWLPTDSMKQDAHARLANWFSKGSVNRRRATEELWGWQQAQEPTLLRKALLNLPLIGLLLQRSQDYELLGYWRSCDDITQIGEAYHKHLDLTNVSTATESHAKMLLRFCEFFRVCGIVHEAIPLAEQAYKIRKRISGTDQPETAEALRWLAVLQEESGYFSEAESLFRQALEIRENVFGSEHEETADILNNLAILLNKTGQFDEAESLFRRGLAIQQQLSGIGHPSTAVYLSNLAMLLAMTGRYTEAEPLFRQTLEIRERASGQSHPDTALSLNNLAAHLKDLGQFDEAEPLYRRALNICETVLGPDHPDTAWSLIGLADLLYDLTRYDEAEPLSRQALKIRENSLGLDHPDTAASLNNLASLLKETERYEEAGPLYRRALDIWKTTLGNDHPHTAIGMHNLAMLLAISHKEEEAEQLFRTALTILTDSLGSNHHIVAHPHHYLGELLLGHGNLSEAKEHIDKALEIRLETIGKENAETAETYALLGRLRHAEGKSNDARHYLHLAQAVFEHLHGSDHPRVKELENTIKEFSH